MLRTHIIHFDEPFGLSVVEAMACGTPVIAYRRGSMLELVEHGVSGLLVDSEAEAMTAVEQLSGLDRLATRAHAETFSASRMVDAYLNAHHVMLIGQ